MHFPILPETLLTMEARHLPPGCTHSCCVCCGLPFATLQARIAWDPDTMQRACRDKGNARQGSTVSCGVNVLDCDRWEAEEMTEAQFFRG